MSKSIQLSQTDAEHLGRPSGTVGALVRFRFVQGGDQDKKWALANIGSILQSLPGPRQTKSLEFWITSTEINLHAWATDKESAKRIVNHWQDFNPAIQHQAAPYHFPPLPADAFVRVGRVAPQRAAKYPFEYHFREKGPQHHSSPIVTLLHNIPLPRDGTTIVIQLLWRKHRFAWFRWPWAEWEFRPWLGTDEDAVAQKRDHHESYYCDIRIAEISSSAANAKMNYTKATAQAFRVYNKEKANRLVYRSFLWWPRRRILHFLRAMQDRNLGAFRMSLWRRPRYTIDELAALIHPPPPGAIVPGLAYTSVRQVAASGTAETQAAALRKAVQDKLNAKGGDAETVQGRARKMKAKDIEAILRRQGEL